MIRQLLNEMVGLDIVANKRILKTFITLCSIILLQLIIMICMCVIERAPIIQEVEIIKEVEVIKTVELIKEVPVEVEPTYTYNITSAEREMLARLVYLEANTESLECQKAIVSVVFNRLNSGYWGDSLQGVVYAPNQFSPANYIWQTTPKDTNYRAVDEVLKFGSTLPQHILYFRANYHFDWAGYNPYKQIDDVCFGYLEKDKK